jgi:putative membrane protein
VTKLRYALAASLIVLVASPAAAKPAREFMNDAVQGDRSEATLGRLIHSRGHSPAVRAYGSILARDHSRAHMQALSLARRMRLSITDTMMPEARRELTKLQRMKGRAFDREVRRYMIDDHTKDIAEFRSQARHGDRQTAELARQTLPVLEKHLRMAEALPRLKPVRGATTLSSA